MKNFFFLLIIAATLTACSKNDSGSKTYGIVSNNTTVIIKSIKVGYMNGAEGRAKLLAEIGELLSSQKVRFQIVNDTVSQVLLYVEADSALYMVTDPYPIVRGTDNLLVISTTTPASKIEPTSPFYPQ